MTYTFNNWEGRFNLQSFLFTLFLPQFDPVSLVPTGFRAVESRHFVRNERFSTPLTSLLIFHILLNYYPSLLYFNSADSVPWCPTVSHCVPRCTVGDIFTDSHCVPRLHHQGQKNTLKSPQNFLRGRNRVQK